MKIVPRTTVATFRQNLWYLLVKRIFSFKVERRLRKVSSRSRDPLGRFVETLSKSSSSLRREFRRFYPRRGLSANERSSRNFVRSLSANESCQHTVTIIDTLWNKHSTLRGKNRFVHALGIRFTRYLRRIEVNKRSVVIPFDTEDRSSLVPSTIDRNIRNDRNPSEETFVRFVPISKRPCIDRQSTARNHTLVHQITESRTIHPRSKLEQRVRVYIASSLDNSIR